MVRKPAKRAVLETADCGFDSHPRYCRDDLVAQQAEYPALTRRRVGSTPTEVTGLVESRQGRARRVLEDQLVCKTDVHRTAWVRSPPRPLVGLLGVSSNGKTAGSLPADEGSTPFASTVRCRKEMARWWNLADAPSSEGRAHHAA